MSVKAYLIVIKEVQNLIYTYPIIMFAKTQKIFSSFARFKAECSNVKLIE